MKKTKKINSASLFRAEGDVAVDAGGKSAEEVEGVWDLERLELISALLLQVATLLSSGSLVGQSEYVLQFFPLFLVDGRHDGGIPFGIGRLQVGENLFEDDVFVDLAVFFVQWSVVILQSGFVVAFVVFHVVVIVVLILVGGFHALSGLLQLLEIFRAFFVDIVLVGTQLLHIEIV